MNFHNFRPKGFTGKGDKKLPKIISDLTDLLIETEESFDYDTFFFDDEICEEIACVLVEFAEDIHNDIGIWNSYEEYNLEFFGTPLPLTNRSDKAIEPKTIDKERICHLLWVLYHELDNELIISPQHSDLQTLASIISDFLMVRFEKVPRDSGVKRFLAHTNKYGWDVKKKLIWMGTRSYLFRHYFSNYIENFEELDIDVVDDFVCMETTIWSGLGVIDILALTLDIPDEQREELRLWYNKHAAYFKVLSSKDPFLELLNVINDSQYTVRVGDLSRHFKPGQLIMGSLVQWKGEWYWSGKQTFIDSVPDDGIESIKNAMLKKAHMIVYRYHDELAEKAREMLNIYYKKFLDYHGDNFIVFPDGISMASVMQEFYRKWYESNPKKVIDNIMKKHNLENPWPKSSYPPEVLKCENGIGVYFNPDEGMEIMIEFNDIVNGLQKNGVNLNVYEESAVRNFITAEEISPQFVNKIVDIYGDESIASSFLISDKNGKSYLEYLLRRYKGHYYRKRYPTLFVE